MTSERNCLHNISNFLGLVLDVKCGETNAEIADLNQRFVQLNEMINEQEIDEELKGSTELFFSKIANILDNFNKVLPAVNALRSEGMKIHHWNKVYSL